MVKSKFFQQICTYLLEKLFFLFIKKVRLKEKNKSIFIKRLIYSIIVTIFLISIFIKTISPKIILLPFLVCSFALIGKNIFLIYQKQKYINIFNKIFIIGLLSFWFGLLIYGNYTSIINKDYSLIIFTIPLWIVGIYQIINCLFVKKSNHV